jgi:CheY-like chemotaxis protein
LVSVSNQRVLVVDDEPAVRKIAERVLQRVSIEVVSAGDGKQALEQLAKYPDIGLILLDASLPDMNAERLLELMKAQGFTTPVLLSSGFGEDCLENADQFPNVRGFLAKPYPVAKLAARIQELLESE